jgi:hypothetical protein
MKPNKYLLVVGIAFLVAAGIGLYKLHIPDLWVDAKNSSEALALSAVVLVGLALVVVLMSVLVIVYSVLGVSDSTQALALPEGSVRALIAFSLVLIFVCLGAFLYNSVNNSGLSPGGKSSHITEAQLSDLKTQFVVAYEPARNTNGSVETDSDGKSPLYNATYFLKPGKDAEDFAKQIFTTLATVFVSVISFYFGSSTTSSAVGAGAKAAGGGGGGGATSSGIGVTGGGGDAQSALNETKAAAHDANAALGRATDAAAKAKSLADAVPSDPSDKKAMATTDCNAAQKALDAVAQASSGADQQVQLASTAVGDAIAGSTDSTKSAAATSAFKARDAAKQLARQADASANEAERLRDKIRSDTEA